MPYKINPCSPSPIKPTVPHPVSVVKGRNWYARNILGTMPQLEYHDGVDAALDAAGLLE